MDLEAQELHAQDKENDIEELAEQLIEGPGRKLWSDE